MSTETNTIEQYTDFMRGVVAEVMDIATVAPTRKGTPGSLRLAGRLRLEPERAYAYLEERFRNLGFTPLLRREGNEEVIIAVPGRIEASTSRLWLSLLLFFLTVASTIGAGMVWFQYQLPLAIAFSASLLSILLFHELGHFLMARRMGVATSYPFFIPMPISPVGTMGAFISMKAPPPDRRALLAIAIAGPLAGLVLTIPILILGLHLSTVETIEPPYLMEGNSLLYATIKFMVFGQFLPDTTAIPNMTLDVSLHPVAFAGWFGLLVTGLNLIPAGQLDGGHILYALVGPEIARKVTWSIVGILIVTGIVFQWYGWFLWAGLIALFGQQRAALLNELVPLTQSQKLLAIAGLILFILVFTPAPLIGVQ
jgi:membrane-associated protease RseP (regulator of RpoE activity)